MGEVLKKKGNNHVLHIIFILYICGAGGGRGGMGEERNPKQFLNKYTWEKFCFDIYIFI